MVRRALGQAVSGGGDGGARRWRAQATMRVSTAASGATRGRVGGRRQATIDDRGRSIAVVLMSEVQVTTVKLGDQARVRRWRRV